MSDETTVVLGDPRLPDAAKPEGRFTAEDLEAYERVRATLDEIGERSGRRFRYLDDHSTLVADLVAAPPARVLNLCDTGVGNVARHELHLPALLELLGVACSGSGPVPVGACYDKALVRAVAASCGVPVPEEIRVPAAGGRRARAARGVERAQGPERAQETEGIGWAGEPERYPVLVKPNTGDGSEGITAGSVAGDAAELARVVDELARRFPERDLLVQEFLPGRELAVGLVGNPGDGWRVLPPLEVDYSGLDPSLPRILAYESKIVPDSPYWTDIRYRPAELPSAVLDRIVGHCERLFVRLGCRDYARFDLREDAAGEPRLLEVNPNPAWCWEGKMHLMAGFAGMSYADFLEAILEAFERRVGVG